MALSGWWLVAAQIGLCRDDLEGKFVAAMEMKMTSGNALGRWPEEMNLQSQLELHKQAETKHIKRTL